MSGANQGSCLCGAVRFEMTGPYKWFTHCHCSMCRKHHGTLYDTSIGIEHANFKWLQGEADIVHYRSTPAFERPFCKHCGSAVPDTSGEAVVVPAGTVDGELNMQPSAHIFVASKSPMAEITDQLKQFDAYPPGYGTVLPTPERKTSGMQGSCLCGEVEFTIDKTPTRLVHCHCSRCRKSRGTAHGANTFVAESSLRFTRGAERIRNFKLPGSFMYGTSFCESCGSMLPLLFAPMKQYMVPVGALDTPFAVQSRVHIYVGSKAPWSAITDNHPQFAELPPRERFAEFF
jgi:hypothetical protein